MTRDDQQASRSAHRRRMQRKEWLKLARQSERHVVKRELKRVAREGVEE